MKGLWKYCGVWLALICMTSHATGVEIRNAAARPDLSRLGDRIFQPDPATEPEIKHEEVEQLKEVESLLQSDLSEAVRILERNVPSSPSAAFLFYMGSFYLREGEHDKATQLLGQAIDQFPNFRRAWRSLAAVQIEQGLYQEALLSLGRALELGAGDVNVFGMIGYCHLQQGNLRAARTAYDRAILLEPDQATWLYGALQCQLGLENYRDALSLLGQLQTVQADAYPHWVLKARILYPMGDPFEATVALETAALYRPLEAEDRLFLADLYLEQGDVMSAVSHYREWSLRVPPERAIRTSLQRLRSVGVEESSQALMQWLEMLKALDPPDAALTQQLQLESARRHLALGHPDAVTSLETLLQEIPVLDEAALLLAEHHAAQGNTVEAERFFTRAFAIESHQYRAAMGLAKLHLCQQRYAEALRELENAHRLNPKDSKLKSYIETLRSYVMPQPNPSMYED